MPHDRVARLVDSYLYRPKREYLLVLSLIKKQGGLSEEEIKSIRSLLPDVHSSAIIRQIVGTTVHAGYR
jgi:hypothetical protein